MSGPKGLSCTVFEKKLKVIFRLQLDIEDNMEQLKEYMVDDRARAISFDSQDFLDKTKDQTEDLLQVYNPAYQGSLSEQRRIEAHIYKLNQFKKKQQQEQQVFQNKQEDYTSYCAYEKYHEHAIENFSLYKESAAERLKTIGEQGKPLQNALEQVEQVKPNFEKSLFSFGFREKMVEKKQQVQELISEEQRKVDAARVGMADAMLAAGGDVPIEVDLSKITGDDDKQEMVRPILAEIQQLLAEVNDDEVRIVYQDQLKGLLASEVFQDIYYYRELLEELRQKEAARIISEELHFMLLQLDKAGLLSAFVGEGSEIRRDIITLLAKSKIRDSSREEMAFRLAELIKNDEEAKRAARLKEREQQYLKQELIAGLEELDYKVVDGGNLIDFEKQQDFVLDVPGQENFLNLRFQEGENKFIYNFLIPEEKESLSMEQTRQKLEEMESACDGFKQVLHNLKDDGLKFNIDRERPVAEESMIRLPEHLRARIQSAQQTGSIRQQLKQRYLDKE